jgi:uncharacterized RDD family membrane protein YckC
MSAKSANNPRDPAVDRRGTSGVACGLTRRMLVMLYDALVIVALMMLATGLVLWIHPATLTAGKDFWYTLCLLAVWFLYLAWCWQHGGVTLGMRAWRVRLVTDNLQPMSWAQSGLRFVTSFISGLPLGAGYFWSLFDRDKRAWHDHWSRSRLLRTQPSA